MNAPWVPLELTDAAAETPSPVDLPAEALTAGALRWTCVAVATAALFLLLFNGGAIRGWAGELPPGPATEPAIAAADAWSGATAAIGLDAPVATMRGWWRAAKDARFTGGGADQR